MNTNLVTYLTQLCTYHKRINLLDIKIIHNYLRDVTKMGNPTPADIERALCQMYDEDILDFDDIECFWFIRKSA